MKRMIGSVMLMVLVLGGLGTAREAKAQQVPELISFVSFYANPRWTSACVGCGAVASTYTVIASLASYRTEVYQLRFFSLISLTSFKLRQADGWTNNTDKTPWLPVPLMSIVASDANSRSADVLLPFAENLWLIPAAPGISTAAAQQRWITLESSARLVIDFQGGGDNTVVGFARFRYVPYGRK